MAEHLKTSSEIGAETPAAAGKSAGFQLQLANFSGPFDLLLRLIGNHQLDITEVALAEVTDEFIGYVQAGLQHGSAHTLDEVSEFLVVAATLLDWKTARLLPQGEVEDDDDIAALEARDLLFARLLQYKAFKELAEILATQAQQAGHYHPRPAVLDPPYDAVLPALLVKTTPADLARLAREVFQRSQAEPPQVSIAHLHHPKVSVSERSHYVLDFLAHTPHTDFDQLCPRGEETIAEYVATVVATFLALLDLYKSGQISLTQENHQAAIQVRLPQDSQSEPALKESQQ